MTIRIRFGAADLARTQVAQEPDPLWEMLLSLQALQCKDGPHVFDKWRELTLRRLSAGSSSLFALAPPRGYAPDFLTPAAAAGGLEEGLKAVRVTSAERLGTDLERLARGRRLPSRVATLDTSGLDRLTELLRTYFTEALAPYWTQIRSHLDAERTVRAHRVLSGGVEHLLGSLHPKLRWDAPVLEVRGVPVERDVELAGRGLRIIPSFFCWRAPVMLRDPALPPVLVYPVEHADGWTGGGDSRDGGAEQPGAPCAALLGRTRAAALEIVARGCTTTELARRLNISPATASHHTAILRDAGLIASHRSGGKVHHMVRSLGAALLRGD